MRHADEPTTARPSAWPVMLDWLGITLQVLSLGRNTRAAEEGRAALADNNPLHPLHSNELAAARVHEWLCGRVKAGYHELSTLLTELDSLDHE